MKKINLNKLHSQYDKINPIERLNLVTAAIACGDEEERNRLFKTCPAYQYKRLDHRFIDKYNNFTLIKFIFIYLCEKYFDYSGILSSNLICLRIQISIYEDLIASLQNKLNPDDPTINEIKEEMDNCQDLVDQFEKPYEDYLSKIKAVLEAYRQFCNEVGLKEEYALQWLGDAGIFSVVKLEYFEDVTTTDELVAENKAIFYKAWSNS